MSPYLCPLFPCPIEEFTGRTLVRVEIQKSSAVLSSAVCDRRDGHIPVCCSRVPKIHLNEKKSLPTLTTSEQRSLTLLFREVTGKNITE